MSQVGGVSSAQLKSFIERIERLEEEKAAVAEQIREVFGEAKGMGFDIKIIRRVDHFIGLIEPTMFVFVGLILAWTVSSIFLPLYETLSTLDY